MSTLTTIIGFFARLFGKKPKDKPIPAPLPGSDRMRLSADGSQRANEALAVIRGYVRQPYQITDRELRIASVSWDDGRAFFARYGYDPGNWKGNREGNFYPPKPGILDAGLIHLISKDLDQPRRVFLALHEFAHVCWHYLLTDREWQEWGMRGWSPEDFADNLARRLLGEKIDPKQTAFFGALEARLKADGIRSIRM